MSDGVECCKEFYRIIARCLIELGCVRSLSRELQSNRIWRLL